MIKVCQEVLKAASTDAALSWRNVVRQGPRTLAPMVAVVFGTVALILAGGFIEWLDWGLREGTIRSGLGHIQIVRAGYLERGTADPFGYLLPDPEAYAAALAGVPQVKSIAPRLKFGGLLSAGASSLSFLGTGIDAAKETDMDSVSVVAGQALSNDERAGIVVGRGVAANAGLKVGDKVVLLANRRGGALSGAEARVRGIFSTVSKAYDDVAIHATLDLARELMGAQGAHVWVVYLEDTAYTASTARHLRARLPRDMDVVPWYDQADFYHKTVRLFSRQVLVMNVIIALVVILTISNMMMTNAVQRTAETATTMVLGTRRRRVLSRYLFEGAFIGLLGGTAGLAVGWALAALISKIGIPMPPPPGMGHGFDGRILVTPALAVHALLMAASTAIFAAGYPAWKASRMGLAEALREGR